MVAELETVIIEEAEEFLPEVVDHSAVPDPLDEAGLAEAILHVEQD